MLVAQSCPALCNLMDCSPPGPSVPEIIQARTLEWVAVSFSILKMTWVVVIQTLKFILYWGIASLQCCGGFR